MSANLKVVQDRLEIIREATQDFKDEQPENYFTIKYQMKSEELDYVKTNQLINSLELSGLFLKLFIDIFNGTYTGEMQEF